jgi:exosome complex exonuclease DIS3/RRP44
MKMTTTTLDDDDERRQRMKRTQDNDDNDDNDDIDRENTNKNAKNTIKSNRNKRPKKRQFSSFVSNNNNKGSSNVTNNKQMKRTTREHYLRDDVYLGISDCPLKYKGSDESKWVLLSSTNDSIIVIDTNVALHQLDVIAHKAITNLVVCSTVLEEVRNRSRNAYERLRELIKQKEKRFFVFSNEFHRECFVGQKKKGESMNDRNDRAIREVVKFYERVVGLTNHSTSNQTQINNDNTNKAAKVVLISDDRGNVLKAKEENLNAMSVRELINKEFAKDFPELVDLCSARTDECYGANENESARNNNNNKSSIAGYEKNNENSTAKKRGGGGGGFIAFEEHLTKEQYEDGVSNGRYREGKIRCSPYSPFTAFVDVNDDEFDVKIEGFQCMNRAMEGDIVGIEIIEDDDDDEGDDDDDKKNENLAAAAAATDAVSLAPIVNEPSTPLTLTLKAKVVRIVKRNWRDRGYACALDIESCADLAQKQHQNENNNNNEENVVAADDDDGGRARRVLCVPNDRKTPKIRINTRHANQIASQRIVIVIDAWLATSPYPDGHFVRALGEIGETASETAALLLEADVDDRPFAPSVHKCVPQLPWKVSDEHVAEPTREDLRNLRVCSVDPPGCRDIDDALSAVLVQRADGLGDEIEIGVHIADVTTFLKPGTPMDEEALRRGTTTYLVERRLDMLPKPLTEDICSLRADVERLAFSVFWRVDLKTMLPRKDVKPRFTKSIIKSSKALTYQKAQEIIDDLANDKSDLANDLRRLRDVAKALREKRMEQGALTLASPEVRFELDNETSNPLDVSLYVSRETNKMVEEMMLLANIAVAERISEYYPSFALLRRHPEPREKMFNPLLETAKLLGLENKLNCQSNKTLAESLDLCVREDDPYFNTLLRLQATRCMSTAKYCSTGSFQSNELYHYGLASPIYTHFTSPIRRYADVIVHRLLSASLGLISIDDVLISSVGKRVAMDNTNSFMKEIAETCNSRHLAGQQAGRASTELHTLKFFKDRTTIAEARVFQICERRKSSNSGKKKSIDEEKEEGEEEEIVAFVPKYGIEARVKVSKEKFNARARMFSKITVKIEVEQMAFGRSKLVVSVV